jgi:predicted 3-demethylubiquinone-9 3-methyltransferase (glyoxalase superfamily)
MQKISPFLWFNSDAEEAVNYYVSVFKDAKITGTIHYGENAPQPAGSVMTISFEMFGLQFTALNGGPGFAAFTPAISFVVKCEDQEEVDLYWEHLLQGGKAMQCGWITDKYGITWQIVPQAMFSLMQSKDAKKVSSLTQAMMKIIKLDMNILQKAYDEA